MTLSASPTSIWIPQTPTTCPHYPIIPLTPTIGSTFVNVVAQPPLYTWRDPSHFRINVTLIKYLEGSLSSIKYLHANNSPSTLHIFSSPWPLLLLLPGFCSSWLWPGSSVLRLVALGWARGWWLRRIVLGFRRMGRLLSGFLRWSPTTGISWGFGLSSFREIEPWFGLLAGEFLIFRASWWWCDSVICAWFWIFLRICCTWYVD